jgi:hypothetical protein
MRHEIIIKHSSVFQLFQISLDNFFKAKAALYEHWKLQPSEIERMPFYEFETTLEILEKTIKDKNNAEKEASGKHQAPNMKMPSMKMPSMKMPKF